MSTITETNETTTQTIVCEKVINEALFIAFAEFLGYESPLISWAEDVCLGKPLESFKQKILKVDAISIFNKMQEKYTIDEIKEWWEQYYPLILEDYEKNINSALPF